MFHNTEAVRDEILRHGLVPAARLVHARLGVAEDFLNVGTPRTTNRPYLMHVGSGIPRKNVGFLVELFVALARRHPELCLVQVGSQWSAEQRALLERNQLMVRVDQRLGIPRQELAALYAHAAVVLVPSLAEGFGLPVIEALSCGTPVIASDLPVFRELGVHGVRFCTPSATAEWLGAIDDLLAAPTRVPESVRERIAESYSWAAHARTILGAYVDGPIQRVKRRSTP